MTLDDYPQTLEALLSGTSLDDNDAQALMDTILAGQMAPERLAALLAALRAKGPSSDELVGFARSMRTHAEHVQAPDGTILDNCGTGGAPRKTFNISTAAAFALATRVVVAKHGNRSITRPSGSADVLERAGADLGLDPAAVERGLHETGIAFLFAPTFHPAMRFAGPVRAALGVKTVFNLLGPLTNPAGATHQVLGVYNPALVPLVAEALARLGCSHGFVLHGLDANSDPAFDEATPCGPVTFVEVRDGRAGPPQRLDPLELGVPRCDPLELLPVPADEAPDLLRAVLDGSEVGPRANAVALNVAFGLVAADLCPDFASGLAEARTILASGDGNTKLDTYLGGVQP